MFSFHTAKFQGSVGFAVVETTDDDVILARASELLSSAKTLKEELNLDLLYLAVVNIALLHSNLLLIGEAEDNLARKAFPALEPGNHSEESTPENTSPSITIETLDKSVSAFSSGEEQNHNHNNNNQILHLGKRVSRKNDYIPAITRVINKENWSLPSVSLSEISC